MVDQTQTTQVVECPFKDLEGPAGAVAVAGLEAEALSLTRTQAGTNQDLVSTMELAYACIDSRDRLDRTANRLMAQCFRITQDDIFKIAHEVRHRATQNLSNNGGTPPKNLKNWLDQAHEQLLSITKQNLMLSHCFKIPTLDNRTETEFLLRKDIKLKQPELLDEFRAALEGLFDNGATGLQSYLKGEKIPLEVEWKIEELMEQYRGEPRTHHQELLITIKPNDQTVDTAVSGSDQVAFQIGIINR